MKKMIFVIMAILMAVSAYAFEISSPTAREYNTTAIDLSISNEGNLDNITYKVDSADYVLACENCSGYNASLTLSEGDHKITARGEKGNDTYEDDVDFDVRLPVVYPDFSLKIISPETRSYDTKKLLLKVESNETLEKIRYKVDDDNYIVGCENCSSFQKNLTLEEGNHVIRVKGNLGDKEVSEEVSFSVYLQERFTLKIISPESKEYNSKQINIEVQANQTLDSIRVKVDDYNERCQNCSSFSHILNLSDGSYVLRATGEFDGKTEEAVVYFRIDTDNSTDINMNYSGGNGLRYSLRFEKLPKLVESGEISDSELAEILKENQLNPGIINRIIKTGKLGNESLEAILTYQKFKATGIWEKMISFFGYKGNTYATQIAERYNLPEKLEQKLVTREDIPKGLAKKVQEKMQERVENRIKEDRQEKDNDIDEEKNKTNSKSMSVGKQEKWDDNTIPPGQEKKQDKDNKKGNNGKGKGKN